MKILSVTDPAFRKYGRIVENVDFTELVEALKRTPCPDNVVYEPSVEALESLPVMEELSRIVYGEMPIQIGYCNGHNTKLNALEYHRDSEINVAATDAVLMLGLLTDVEADHTYDTSKVEAFLVPAGTAVEIYATTLHYAPCHTEEGGFQVAIVLPRGTNYPLKGKHAVVREAMTGSAKHDPGVGTERCGVADAVDGICNEDAMLTAVNKWLIGHEEGGLEEGCFLGLKGRNLCLGE